MHRPQQRGNMHEEGSLAGGSSCSTRHAVVISGTSPNLIVFHRLHSKKEEKTRRRASTARLILQEGDIVSCHGGSDSRGGGQVRLHLEECNGKRTHDDWIAYLNECRRLLQPENTSDLHGRLNAYELVECRAPMAKLCSSRILHQSPEVLAHLFATLECMAALHDERVDAFLNALLHFDIFVLPKAHDQLCDTLALPSGISAWALMNHMIAFAQHPKRSSGCAMLLQRIGRSVQ